MDWVVMQRSQSNSYSKGGQVQLVSDYFSDGGLIHPLHHLGVLVNHWKREFPLQNSPSAKNSL